MAIFILIGTIPASGKLQILLEKLIISFKSWLHGCVVWFVYFFSLHSVTVTVAFEIIYTCIFT